jgi:CheY-like chemotaxis protein
MLILFVDDDTEDFEVFCEALMMTHPEIRCIHAMDGIEAMDMLNELIILPKYIFLDVNMPLMDGREVLKRIKANAKLKDIPVIIYSTTTNEAEKASFRKLGAHYFLVKPGTYLELQSSLSELIR